MTKAPHENTDREFQQRMNMLIEAVGGATELARRARLSRRVIDKYRTGESDPSRTRLVALANAGAVRLEWLASGEGGMRGGDDHLSGEGEKEPPVERSVPVEALNPALLARLLQVVLDQYRDGRVRMDPAYLGTTVAALYVELISAYDTDDERLIGLKLQIDRLRKTLSEGACGKAK